MFGILKRVLPHNRRTDAPPSHDGRITSQERLVALLVRASSAHVLFSVRLPGQSHSFSTALLGIYDEHSFIILDELAPEHGHRLLQTGNRLVLTGQLDDRLLRFETRLIEVREKNGFTFYKSSLPERVDYRQQRSARRTPSTGPAIAFHALRGKGSSQILKGYVSDLSLEGAGIVLSDDVELYAGEIISSCIMHLPREGEVAFSLKVCYCKQNSQQQVTRIGGRFVQIDARALQKIRKTRARMEHSRTRPPCRTIPRE